MSRVLFLRLSPAQAGTYIIRVINLVTFSWCYRRRRSRSRSTVLRRSVTLDSMTWRRCGLLETFDLSDTATIGSIRNRHHQIMSYDQNRFVIIMMFIPMFAESVAVVLISVLVEDSLGPGSYRLPGRRKYSQARAQSRHLSNRSNDHSGNTTVLRCLCGILMI